MKGKTKKGAANSNVSKGMKTIKHANSTIGTIIRTTKKLQLSLNRGDRNSKDWTKPGNARYEKTFKVGRQGGGHRNELPAKAKSRIIRSAARSEEALDSGKNLAL